MGKQHVSFGCVGRHVGGRVTKTGTTAKHRASPEVRAIAKTFKVSNAVAKAMLYQARVTNKTRSDSEQLAADVQLMAQYQAKL